MNIVKKKIVSAKTYVAAHKKQVAIAATAATVIAIQYRAISKHNEFLKENGLYNDFYAMTDED